MDVISRGVFHKEQRGDSTACGEQGLKQGDLGEGHCHSPDKRWWWLCPGGWQLVGVLKAKLTGLPDKSHTCLSA